VDISLFAAHLCTLNLAARDIRDEENYPRVRRGNFFESRRIGGRKSLLYAAARMQANARPVRFICRHSMPSLAIRLTCAGTHTRRGQNGVKRCRQGRLLELCAEFWPKLETQRAERPALLLLACRNSFLEGQRLVWLPCLVELVGCRIRLRLAIMVLTNFKIHAILESTPSRV